MSLRPILRLLGIHDDGRTEAEEAQARRAGAEAGLARLEELASAPNVNGDAVAYLRMHTERAKRWTARDGSGGGVAGSERSERSERPASSYRDLRSKMIAAERDAIVSLRDEGTIGDDAMRRVQRELDFETMLLENSEDDAPDSPYEAS